MRLIFFINVDITSKVFNTRLYCYMKLYYITKGLELNKRNMYIYYLLKQPKLKTNLVVNPLHKQIKKMPDA